MKRLFFLFLVLMLISIPILAEESSLFDFSCNTADNGNPVYYFKDLSLTLPSDWNGKITVVQSENGVSFFQTASHEAYLKSGISSGGFLFQLRACSDESYQQMPSYEYLGFSESSGVHYYLLLPSDYPAFNDNLIRAEYDKMYDEVRLIADNALVFSDQNTASAEEQASEASGAAWTSAQVRYFFEHNMLPRYFFAKPENMLNVLEESGLYTLWASVSTENGVDPTYAPEDYVSHWYTSSDGITIVQEELPDPEASTLCYRIYFLYNPGTGDAAYYTLESDDFVPNLCFVCMWTKDMEHVNYGAKNVFDKSSADYQVLLFSEAEEISELAGYSSELYPASNFEYPNLSVIQCPELGFSFKADPSYPFDYQAGTGISLYTENKGSIPYIIVYQGEDKLAEPFEYIQEQFTPHMKKQYGENLLSYAEYESFEIGGRLLPAGVYTYRLQGYLIDMIRIYDSTGPQTVAYTAKYIQGRGDATLAALDIAVRTFERSAG